MPLKFHRYTSAIKSSNNKKILTFFDGSRVFSDPEQDCLKKELKKNLLNLSNESLAVIFSHMTLDHHIGLLEESVLSKNLACTEKILLAQKLPESQSERIAEKILDMTCLAGVSLLGDQASWLNIKTPENQVKLFKAFLKLNSVKKDFKQDPKPAQSFFGPNGITSQFSPFVIFGTGRSVCASKAIKYASAELVHLFVKEADLSFDLVKRSLLNRQMHPLNLETMVELETKYGFDKLFNEEEMKKMTFNVWKNMIPEAKALALKNTLMSSLSEPSLIKEKEKAPARKM